MLHAFFGNKYTNPQYFSCWLMCLCEISFLKLSMALVYAKSIKISYVLVYLEFAFICCTSNLLHNVRAHAVTSAKLIKYDLIF